MKRIIAAVFIFAFAFAAYGQSSPSEQAESLFAKGEFLQGMNILTAVMNASDPLVQASALETYAKFYENYVGNFDYALILYANVLKTNLSADHPIKISAQKGVDRLRTLKTQYGSENVLLKRMRPAESMSRDENNRMIIQLLTIIEKKPQFYRLSEVYYYLGRNNLAVENYRQAYMELKKAVELKPAINFYLPVNVYKDMAYGKWVRTIIHTVSYGTAGVLLIITMAAFYAARPWKWLKLRHLIAGVAIILLWLIILSISYPLLVSGGGLTDKTIVEIIAPTPCFISYWTDNPNRQVLINLFLYGLVGISGLFVFSVGTSRLKFRWAALLINIVFALLLFASLTTIFYMQNCDQKSAYYTESQTSALGYIRGGSYYVSFNMEPYILTNPKAYPNLAISNIADVHLREWILKYCFFSSAGNQTAPGGK
jgi:hypothetical protein